MSLKMVGAKGRESVRFLERSAGTESRAGSSLILCVSLSVSLSVSNLGDTVAEEHAKLLHVLRQMF